MAGQPHAVCLTRPRETVTCTTSAGSTTSTGPARRCALADPRVTHELTLDVDGYGNVLRGRVGGLRPPVPRRRPDPALPAWAATAVQQAQIATHATVTVNGFTNAVDEPARLPDPAAGASRARYELINVPAAAPALLRSDQLRALCDAAGDGAHDLPYEDVDPAGAVPTHRRTGGWSSTRGSLYRRDDLAGALPLGEVAAAGPAVRELPAGAHPRPDRSGLPPGTRRRRHRPAARPDGGAGRRGRLPARRRPRAAGLFPADDPDGHWWMPSGRLLYSPARPTTRPPSWRTPWRTSSCPAGSSTRSAA